MLAIFAKQSTRKPGEGLDELVVAITKMGLAEVEAAT
jgi:hypothetical protein